MSTEETTGAEKRDSDLLRVPIISRTRSTMLVDLVDDADAKINTQVDESKTIFAENEHDDDTHDDDTINAEKSFASCCNSVTATSSSFSASKENFEQGFFCFNVERLFGIRPDRKEKTAKEKTFDVQQTAPQFNSEKPRDALSLAQRYMLRSPLFCAVDVPANGTCFFHAVFGAYWRNLTGDTLLYNGGDVKAHFAAHMHGAAPGYEPWLLFNRAARRLELSRLAPVSIDSVRICIARSCTIAMRLFYVASTLCFPRAQLIESDELRFKYKSLLDATEEQVAHYRQVFFDTLAYSLALWHFFNNNYQQQEQQRQEDCLQQVDDTVLLYTAMQSIGRHMFRQTSALQLNMREFFGAEENLALLSAGQLQALADAAGQTSGTDSSPPPGSFAKIACHVQTLDMLYSSNTTQLPAGCSIWASQAAAHSMAQLLSVDIYTLYASSRALSSRSTSDSELGILFDSALGDAQSTPTSDALAVFRQPDDDTETTLAKSVYLTSIFLYNPNNTHYMHGRQRRFDSDTLFVQPVMSDSDARLILTGALARGLLEQDCCTVSLRGGAQECVLDDDIAIQKSCYARPFAFGREIMSSRADTNEKIVNNVKNAMRDALLPFALPEVVRILSRVSPVLNSRDNKSDNIGGRNEDDNVFAKILAPVRQSVRELVGDAAPSAIAGVETSLLQVFAHQYVYPCLHIDNDDWRAYEALIERAPPLSDAQRQMQQQFRHNLPLDAQADPRYRLSVPLQRTAAQSDAEKQSDAETNNVASGSSATEMYQASLRYVLAKLRLLPNIPTCSVYLRYPATDLQRWRQFVFVARDEPQSCATTTTRDWRAFPIVASDLRVYEVRLIAPSDDGIFSEDNDNFMTYYAAVASGDNLANSSMGAFSFAIDDAVEFVGTSLETRIAACSDAFEDRLLAESYRWSLLQTVTKKSTASVGAMLHGGVELPALVQYDCPESLRAPRTAVMYDSTAKDQSRSLRPMPVSYVKHSAATGREQEGATNNTTTPRNMYAVRDRAYLLSPLVRRFVHTRPPLAPYAQSGDEHQWVPFAFDAPLASIVDAVLQHCDSALFSYSSLVGCNSKEASGGKQRQDEMCEQQVDRSLLAMLPAEAYSQRSGRLSGKKRELTSNASAKRKENENEREEKRQQPVQFDNSPLFNVFWNGTSSKH